MPGSIRAAPSRPTGPRATSGGPRATSGGPRATVLRHTVQRPARIGPHAMRCRATVQRPARMVRTQCGVGPRSSVRRAWSARYAVSGHGPASGAHGPHAMRCRATVQRQARMVRTLEGRGRQIRPQTDPTDGSNPRVHAREVGSEARRTRWIDSALRLPCPPCAADKNDRPLIEPDGCRSHAETVRPSAGKADRRSVRCASTRRRFVLESVTTTQDPTAAGAQPRS
jgi:hypothetical protein